MIERATCPLLCYLESFNQVEILINLNGTAAGCGVLKGPERLVAHEHAADNFDHFSFLDWCAGKGTNALCWRWSKILTGIDPRLLSINSCQGFATNNQNL